MGEVLEHLQYDLDGYHQTKLKYIHDRTSSLDRIEIFAYCCPSLQHIYFDTPESGTVKEALVNFTNLKKLKVSKLNCAELNEVMELNEKTYKLKLISLEIVNGRGSLDLTSVAKACCNLQRLAVYYSMAVHVSVLHSPQQQLHFPCLKEMMIYCTELRGNYCIPILKSCPAIEKLTLCQCDTLTDDDFVDALDVNPLKQLTAICLLFAPNLSTRTIWTMVTCLDRYALYHCKVYLIVKL